MAKQDRGFASMDREKQRQIASKGGKAAHEKGRAHEWTVDEAREAGHRAKCARGARLLPQELHVRRRAGDEHEIARSVAQRLISDAGLAAVCIKSRWRTHVPKKL